MEAYLDYSATTRCSARVREIVLQTMDSAYGNPSSMHKKGVEAERYVKEAAQKIAKTLKVSEKEILFTSGGTESNNLALTGAAMAHRRTGNRLITTQIEHPSVYQTMEYLKQQGFEVIYLPVGPDGIVSQEALYEAVNDQTILVSVMQVNNETGSVQPLGQISRILHQKNPKTLFHVDAVQSYGKLRIRPKQLGIDLMSVSGHKIHGPKGVGFLYIREKTKIKPVMFGGGQQSGLRSGTLNVPGIAGIGEAAAEAYEDFEQKIAHLYRLKQELLAQTADIDGIVYHGTAAPGMVSQEAVPGESVFSQTDCDLTAGGSAPHIVNLSVPGVRSEVMLHALEDCGVYVSAGSACSSSHPEPSRTLQALHLAPELVESALRFSFGSDTKMEEIRYAAQKLSELAPKLRRYTRR